MKIKQKRPKHREKEESAIYIRGTVTKAGVGRASFYKAAIQDAIRREFENSGTRVIQMHEGTFQTNTSRVWAVKKKTNCRHFHSQYEEIS